MSEHFRIVHFAATDTGGPGHSALRIHQGLYALEQDSSLLLKKQTHRARGAFELEYNLPTHLAESAAGFDIFQRWYLDHNRTPISNSAFTLGESGVALDDHPLVKEADVLHLHSVARFLSPAGIGSLARLGKPVVWTLHDHRPFTGGCHFPGDCARFTATCSGCPQLGWDPYFLPESQLADALELIPARRFTCVAPTRFLAAKARESALFAKSRVEVIPYGVDPKIFQLKWKPQAKNHLGLDGNAVHLLFVANQLGESRKGFERLAKAIQLCLSRPKFKERADKGEIALISLGHPDPELGALGIPYVGLGHLNSPEEMSQLYGAADLLLLPSSEENLPNTLLEAMSCGTPVVAFAAGGVPEVLTDDQTGRLVPVGADGAFALAIEQLLFDEPLRLRLAEKCRQTILDRFTQQHQAERYLQLYRELMRGLPRSPRDHGDFGFRRAVSYKVEQLAPIGARLQQICVGSLPRPLSRCLLAMQENVAADAAALQEIRHEMELQQKTIEQLQSELAEQRGVLRKQETTIFQQDQILGSRAIRMLRQLKLINH